MLGDDDSNFIKWRRQSYEDNNALLVKIIFTTYLIVCLHTLQSAFMQAIKCRIHRRSRELFEN
jgi:hypothetical protein